MKVLFASSSSGSRGGGEKFLVYLGQALARRGHEVALWVSAHERMDEIAAEFSALGRVGRAAYRNTYDRPTRPLGAWLDCASARTIAREWRALAPDVVHLNKQNLEDGLDLVRAATLAEIPALATIHITQSARYLRARGGTVRDWIARRALRTFRGPLVAVAESRGAELAAFLGGGADARAIPNGVPLADLTRRAAIRAERRAALGLAPDALVFVAVGRLVAQKRPLLFLAHAARILAANPAARFVWVGDGLLAGEWQREVARLGLAHAVQCAGWQSEVAPFFAVADALLHTAEYEGLPLAILEAMAAALPCVVTPNLRAELPFLKDDVSVAIDDAGAWLRVAGDAAELQRRGAAARALAEREFSFETMAARYEALYRDVCGTQP